MTNGKGAFRLKDLYRAATGEEISDKTAFNTDGLIGKEIMVTVVEARDPQGNLRPFPDVKAVAQIKH